MVQFIEIYILNIKTMATTQLRIKTLALGI